MVLFTQLKNKPVIDVNGENIGRVVDFIFVDGEDFGEITHMVYLSDEGYRKKIPWSVVKDITETKSGEGISINLHVESEDANPSFERKSDLLMGKLIDKQIVDVDGIKVVRVNDILLCKHERKFVTVGFCIGTRSFLRRLGMGAFMKLKEVKEKVIPWDSVEPLEHDLHKLHSKLKKSKIAELHPRDIADIMEDLSSRERTLIFDVLTDEKAAETLIEADPNVQQSMFKNIQVNRIVHMLESVPADQAADILSLMTQERAHYLLKNMEAPLAKKIKEILDYPEESAGSFMHPDMIAIPNTFTARKVIQHVRKIKPPAEKTYHLYVVDSKKKLLGFLSFRSLITANPKDLVTTIMNSHVVKVNIHTSKQEIANSFSKYGIFALPVVDDDNVLKGVVEADDVISEVIPEKWKKTTIKHHHKTHHKKKKKK